MNTGRSLEGALHPPGDKISYSWILVITAMIVALTSALSETAAVEVTIVVVVIVDDDECW